MGDSTRKSKSSKKAKNSIGCLLLRPRRRANSEPPKGKRFEREKTCSSRTHKPRKIARDEAYREGKHSESDSGFLSFESVGSKRSNVSYPSINQISCYNEEREDDEEIQRSYIVGNERPGLFQDHSLEDQPDIVDLNDNSFPQFYQQDNRHFDSDRASLASSNVCVQCSCLPRIFKSRHQSTKESGADSSGSYSQRLDDSLFDLRGSNLLRTISDLRSSIAERSSRDKDQCFLKLVYSEHCCGDPRICSKEKFAALNAHLQTLVDCMPRSYCDCESSTNWNNYILNETGYISHRRNAVCETTNQSRETVCKAFCSFMTLKALLRYDLL